MSGPDAAAATLFSCRVTALQNRSNPANSICSCFEQKHGSRSASARADAIFLCFYSLTSPPSGSQLWLLLLILSFSTTDSPQFNNIYWSALTKGAFLFFNLLASSVFHGPKWLPKTEAEDPGMHGLPHGAGNWCACTH
jgi:hypothetical protein